MQVFIKLWNQNAPHAGTDWGNVVVQRLTLSPQRKKILDLSFFFLCEVCMLFLLLGEFSVAALTRNTLCTVDYLMMLHWPKV